MSGGVTLKLQKEDQTYESIYYDMWELSARYARFTAFRVIGNSHDERMIPMLEIGEGDRALFCLGGIYGTDRHIPCHLVEMAEIYCRAYEADRELEELYRVRKLLDEIRLCMIPLLNPDGYEVCGRGCSAVRNPINRQMLKMQMIPSGSFYSNSRGINLRQNFPTFDYVKARIGRQCGSENETRALMRIFQEYDSAGLLSFCGWEQKQAEGNGSPEKYYTQTVHRPAMLLKIPEGQMAELKTLPLEYIFTVLE